MARGYASCMAEPADREHVLESLKPLGLVMARPALGGIGLHLNGVLFGVLHSGLMYLKVDRGRREEYHAAGMRPLEPRPGQKLEGFYQVPDDVLGKKAELLKHAARAAGRPAPKPPSKKASARRVGVDVAGVAGTDGGPEDG